MLKYRSCMTVSQKYQQHTIPNISICQQNIKQKLCNQIMLFGKFQGCIVIGKTPWSWIIIREILFSVNINLFVISCIYIISDNFENQVKHAQKQGFIFQNSHSDIYMDNLQQMKRHRHVGCSYHMVLKFNGIKKQILWNYLHITAVIYSHWPLGNLNEILDMQFSNRY